jgi:death-on-curing protein
VSDDGPLVEGRPYEHPPIEAIIELHAELLEAHGGAPGIRDVGMLEASLARPYQLIAYSDERLTIVDLATAVCVSIVRNHPFVDGNKRTGFLALGLVLGLNGFVLDVSEREATDAVLGLAAGRTTEESFRDWVARNSYQE